MSTDATATSSGTALPIDQQIGAFWSESFVWISNHSLQIVIGVAVATLIVAGLMGMKALGLRLCRSDPGLNHWRSTIGKALSKTRFWFMIAVAAQLVAGYAQAPGLVATTVRFAFTVATALQVAIWVRELVIGAIEHRAGGNEAQGGLGSAIDIIRLLVTVVVFAIAVLMILDNLGVNVTGLVAGLGIGGIAIGMAAKGIFDDLFSALSIIFDKPFRRGDSVQWDKTSGTVESIGLKSTRVRAVTGEEVVISNTNLLNKELHNMARLARRRVVQTFELVYQTPAETCERVPAIIREVVEAQDKCELVRAGVTGFTATGIAYEYQFDVHSEAYKEVFDARNAVCIALLDRFAKSGIDFVHPAPVPPITDPLPRQPAA